jgi:hypothetical protein
MSDHETPNHDYNVPDAGTLDWHELLNANFEAFDNDIEIRDTGDPGTNGYTPADGAKYLDTDTGAVYLGDGSSWTEAFSFGGGGGGGGIESLSGGDGIDPASIGDGDTLSVVWGDADALGSAGALTTGAVGSDALAAQVAVDELDVGTLTGPLTGGVTLSDIAGDNLSIDNGTLNASGSGGSTSLSGGDGINPGSITDGDTLSVAWGDASDLDTNGNVADWSGAADLDASGNVTASFIAGLSGGEGISPSSIGDGDELSVAWEDANDLNQDGNVTNGGIQSLTGGDGIDPSSIGDGDTVSVAPGDIAGTFLSTSVSDELTVDAGSGLENDGSGNLQAALGTALGFDGSDQIAVTTDSVTVAGNSVSLGGSTGIDHGDLSNITSDDHHTRPSAGDGLSDTSGTFDIIEGRYVSVGSQSVGFSGPAEWENAGEIAVNTATGTAATVGGGEDNEASGQYSTVAGGGPAPFVDTGNTANGSGTVVGGGAGNLASALYATVGGGQGNEVSGQNATVAGGRSNVAGDANATVAGGQNNSAQERSTSVGGGQGHFVYSDYSTVGGGETNQAGVDGDAITTRHATVAGGEGNVASGEHSTVGGGDTNEATGTAATVGGGEDNEASGQYSTVAGGGPAPFVDTGNTANGSGTVVGGGAGNLASALYATVGGGQGNEASGQDATVAGGRSNTASENYATMGGGWSNTASGSASTVPGGQYGAAKDSYSFVWNDATEYHAIPNSDSDGLSSDTAVDGEPVTGSNTFSVSATNGFRFITGSASNPNVTYIPGSSAGWTTTSSRAVKTNIDPVDPQEALDGVESMEVATWEYESEDGDGAGTTHIGPMAGDFHDAFDVGPSDEHINSINADGVALAAIQGLSAELDETQAALEAKATRIADQQETIDDLESEVERKDDRIDALEAENAALRERVAAIEAHVGLGDAGEEVVADD